MIPARKKSNQVQINRTFDSVDEMEAHVRNQYPGATVVKFWNVSSIACVIDIPEKPTQQQKKSK